MTTHPNTVASLISTGLAALLYHVAHRYGWVRFSVDDGILAAGAVTGAVLFVGRRGLWPTILSLKALVLGAQGAPPTFSPLEVEALKAILAQLESAYVPVPSLSASVGPLAPQPVAGPVPPA